VYVFLIQIGDMLKFNMDSIIITAFIGLAAVTHYGIATQMTINFMILMGTIMGVLMPVFSRLESENDQLRIKKAFFLTTKIAICLASFIAFGLIFWGKYFIERWMGPDYLDAYPCLVILVIGCTVGQWQSASLAILFGTSKHRYYAIANGVEAALNIGLSLLLVRKYGIVGMAIGVVTPTILIVLFVQPVYVCRLIGISLKEYLNEVARTLVAVVGALVIPLAITRFYGAAMYGRLLAVGAASLIAYLPVVAMYAFKAQESTLIRKAIMPRRFA
jgi:O-antigen/teichoic acid export membrane protein